MVVEAVAPWWVDPRQSAVGYKLIREQPAIPDGVKYLVVILPLQLKGGKGAGKEDTAQRKEERRTRLQLVIAHPPTPTTYLGTYLVKPRFCVDAAKSTDWVMLLWRRIFVFVWCVVDAP